MAQVKRRSHVTLDDIAKRLRVSRVTVSKALRGHPDISTEMTKRVRKIANELGYTPNIMARNLSSRRTQMIGVVVPKIAHFFFSSLLDGVYNTAFEHNYEPILTVSQENSERELKHLQTLVAMRVDGILISISQYTDDPGRFLWIKKLGIPLVFVDRQPEPPLAGFSSVLADDRGGALRAVAHAISVGYRKIAFVGGTTRINIGRERLGGFEDAMREAGIPINPDWMVLTGHGKDNGYEGLKRIYQCATIPEFIFAATYPVALGIYEAARELGLSIPGDIDLICFGDSDVGSLLSPAISVVLQPTQELGARAVRMLLEDISSADEPAERHVVLPTQLVIRETCTRKVAHGGRRQSTGGLVA